jgi:hypothetical protein
LEPRTPLLRSAGEEYDWRGDSSRAEAALTSFIEDDIRTPFSGYRKSGPPARDEGVEAMDQYPQTKTIWIEAASTV